MAKFDDITGNKYGLLTVLYRDSTRRGNVTFWMCECACGNSISVRRDHLLRGNTRSCGCMTMKWLIEKRKIHGMTNTPEFKAWRSMLSRCYYDKDVGYKNYGEKGITVHDEWRKSFVAWFAYVGLRPSPGHSLDRIDNSKGYEPGNVRWATITDQNRNHSKMKLSVEKAEEIRQLYAAGVTQKEIASLYGICFQCVSEVTRGKTWKKVVSDETDH